MYFEVKKLRGLMETSLYNFIKSLLHYLNRNEEDHARIMHYHRKKTMKIFQLSGMN